MSDTQLYQFRRDDTPAFDPRSFYTVNNPNLPTHSLGAGIFKDTVGAIDIRPYNTSSSENWQFFFQSGRYFIRNWDYGDKMQLGVTEESRSTPRLYPRNGNLSQQWNLVKADGGWKMTNGLLGEEMKYALPKNRPLPFMRSEVDGTVWNITVNPSAAEAQPLEGNWISPVDNFQEESSSTLSSATTSDSRRISLPSTTPIASISSSDALTTSRSSLSDIPTSAPKSSPSLSSGAIAGIVIGALALFSAFVLGIWFCLVKRKQRQQLNQHGHSAPVVRYAYNAAELPVPPAELAGNSEKVSLAHRAELGSAPMGVADRTGMR